MSHPKSSDDEDLLPAPIIAEVFRRYALEIAPLSTLGSELPPARTRTSPRADTENIPSEDRKTLCVRAITRLADHERRLANRPLTRLDDWRIIHYAVAGARTLREALFRCAKCFEAFDGRCGSLSVRASGGTAAIRFDPLPMRANATNCLVTIGSLGQFHVMLGWLVAQSIPIRSIALRHGRDAFDDLALPDLGWPILLGADHCGYTFDAAYLNAPVVRTAEELHLRPRHTLMFSVQSDIHAGGAAIHVRQLLLRRMQETQRLPSFEAVADAFGSSVATLRRRLSAEGTKYREIKDDVRRQAACDLLKASKFSIEEISDRLDYCNSNAFRLAFRTWFGEAPSHYRKRAPAVVL